MAFLTWTLDLTVLPPGIFLCISPFLQKGGVLFESSQDARVRASRGFSSTSARLVPAGGGEEPLVARLVLASSLLSPRFIRGLGMRELLFGSELLMFLCPFGSPSSSLYF